MTPKQILDSFSETLIRDDRILSAQERSLIATLLQHAKNPAVSTPEARDAAQRIIASAIGEAVAQRAFAVLGSSIVERILESSAAPPEGSATGSSADGVKAQRLDADSPRLNAPPPSPSPQPQQPGVPRPAKVPLPSPTAPSPAQPQNPGHGQTKTVVSKTAVATVALPEYLRAQCVVLDEFLAPQEVAELTRFTLDHEADLQTSEVVSPLAEDGVVDHEYRRSRVLMDLEKHQDIIVSRIKTVLPQVLRKLGMEEFEISSVEAQITASNDGDFFQFHNDNGSDPVAGRHLTFVYFFHREPRQFEGGELRIHDARLESGAYVSEGTYQTIVPQQNQIVFFPCELLHEITPVRCPSRSFSDSRFTLNGWLRR
jgi:Rps23 Pro-64 3,4-dihydroxylase Tpa1-like proline 4-hydroxylase